jgi:hypothetical protein
MTEQLKFSKGNAKLGKKVVTFSIRSGHDCPYAKDCLSKNVNGKIQDGPHTLFRCFSASQEVVFPNVWRAREHNAKLVRACKTAGKMRDMILRDLPPKSDVVRIHVAGDFFSQMYFDAWMLVALDRPDILFYAYTKALPFWVARRGALPTNFVLTASKGGRKDDLIAKYGLRYAQVVYSVEEANLLGLEIDSDDSHAMKNGPSFALLIHGVQPAGSFAGAAKKALKGVGSYGKSGKH